MSSFLSCLPSDIVLSIFLYLDKKDTVECMRVCRRWYTEIPLYATDVWKSIFISFTSMRKPNNCEFRCLGPHVRNVLIQGMDVQAILKALKNNSCELAEIEIYHVTYRPETPNICSEARLLSTISLFANTLKTLIIVDHCSNVSPLRFLSSLPNLAHFSLAVDDGLHDISSSDGDISCNPSNLVYLNLEYIQNFDHRIMPILPRCPKLKVLILSSTVTEITPLPDNWNQILRRCPRLHYFGLNDADAPRDIKDITALTAKFDDSKGIRELVFRDNVEEINSISTLLSRLDQLETLKLSNREIISTQWNSLSHVHLPRLKSMALHNLLVRNDEWNTFCACHPNLVRFTYNQLRVNGLDIDSMMSGISTLKHLERLDVYLFTNNLLNQIPYRWSNVRMLSKLTRLQKLKLAGVRFAENVFLDLCRLLSLKELDVSLWPFQEDIQFAELLVFADRLQETGVEKLALSYFNFVNDKILERLAQATQLSMLRVLECDYITDAGVVAFIKKNKTIEVNNCKLVSRTGIWTDEEVSY